MDSDSGGPEADVEAYWERIVSAKGYAQLIPQLHPCPVTLICVVLLIVFLRVDFCSLWQVI